MKVSKLKDEVVVECKNISKVYDLNVNKKDSLVSFLTLGLINHYKPFAALRDINFSVEAGISVGIIGLNGSGKSTLSNIIGGIIDPSLGSVYTKGKAALIAIGAGLNNDFTGIENIYYKCYMHGLSKKEIENKIDEIITFSELDNFIHQPLKSYSSGMRSRLGFSIAIHCEPDILIIDEALSVGDETFANKCLLKIKELQQNKKNIFFVSHSASQIKKMCDKALWLHHGKLINYGDVDDVVKMYVNFINDYKSLNKKNQLSYKSVMLKEQEKQLDEFLPTSYNTTSKTSIGILCLLIPILVYLIISSVNIL